MCSDGFSRDGKQVVTARGDGTARIWTIEPKEPASAIMKSKDSTNVDLILQKINIEKVRGDVYQLSEADKKVYGIE